MKQPVIQDVHVSFDREGQMIRQPSMALVSPLAGAALAAALVVWTSPVLSSAPCDEGQSTKSKQVAAGIELIEEACESPLYHAFIVKMDLGAGQNRFFVTPYNNRLETTSAFATRYEALVAVNGGFWGSEWGGFTVSDGKLWSKDAFDYATSTVVGFGERDDEGRLVVDIRPTEEALDAPPGWMRQALTGIPMLLADGKVMDVKNDHTLFTHKHPRTALGLSEDGSTLIVAVIDGRRPDWSLGMRTSQVAQLLLAHGAHRALNLDGGASSTLVIPSMGGLVNKPCHKKAPERIVPNHLGILRESPGFSALLGRVLGPLAGLLV